jgi:hypothetical protein
LKLTHLFIEFRGLVRRFLSVHLRQQALGRALVSFLLELRLTQSPLLGAL